MSVYVDPLANLGWCFRGKHIMSCHLFTDTPGDQGLAELLAFGLVIGLKGNWLMNRWTGTPHFDLVPSKREKAVEAGAIPVSRERAVVIWRERREACAPSGRQGQP